MMSLAVALDSFGDVSVERAFETLYETLTAAQIGWRGSEVAEARLDHAMADMLHHVSMAIPGLAPAEAAPEVERLLAREAYLSVMQVTTLAVSIGYAEPAMQRALEPTRTAAHALLDRLSPYVEALA